LKLHVVLVKILLGNLQYEVSGNRCALPKQIDIPQQIEARALHRKKEGAP